MMGERRIIPVTPNKRRAPALYELIAPKPRETDDAAAAAAAARAPHAQPAPTPAAPRPAPVAPAPTHTAKPTFAPNTPNAHTPRPAPAPVAVAPTTYTAAQAPIDDEPESDKVLGITPGSRLNIPVGFAFVAMALVIAAVIAAYSLGYSKMEKQVEARKAGELAKQNEGIVDPTATQTGGSATPVIPGINNAGANPSTATQPNRQPSQATKPPAPQPEEPKPTSPRVTVVKSAKDDPRKVGLNYPTVATLPIKEATAAAEFLVSKGYPTILAPSPSDSRLFTVVPLIGLEREGYQKNSEAEARKLRELGRAFKRDQKGATDFNDLFWKKFDR
jgi:uncharacterized protein (UPF0333 family)